MSDPIARALGGLAVVGLLANAMFLVRVDRKVDALNRASAAERLAGDPGVRSARPDGDEPPRRVKFRDPVNSDDPAEGAAAGVAAGDAEAVKALIAQTEDERWKERRQRWEERTRESTVQEVAAFAQENGLDAATETAVREELLLLQQGMGAVRDDMHEERISLFDGRNEMRALVEDSDARLVELLGEGKAAALRERVGGGRGGRGGPGMGPP
jgi:hypothetical protein